MSIKSDSKARQKYYYSSEEYYSQKNYSILIREVKRMNQEEDDIFFRISLAADSHTYITYRIEHMASDECKELILYTTNPTV